MADGTARVSAGPPDPSRMPPAATPDHNGEAGEECRLTYVPGAAGNATLGRTFAELGAVGLPASWAVLDAGYWSAGDVRATGGAGIKFLTRPGPNVRALAAARNQRRKACDDKAVTCEPTSAANELYRAIGAKCPVEVPFVCGKNWGRELRIIR